MSPETTTSTTWLRAITSRTIGVSVSIGNVVIVSTRFLTSSTTRRASAPSSSSATTDAPPSEAVERIRRMPSMLWIASSTRMTTPCSTSSGAAARYGPEH